MKKETKAEITSKQIVYILLIIIGFAIIILFLTQISWTGLIDREACHQSVILRATMPSLGGVKELIPLKCKTQKVCITTGWIGGNCAEDYGTGKGVVKVKVSSKEDIEKYLARDMIDCWSMMGEGKVSVFSQWVAETYGLGEVYPTCVVCSRIAFDSKNLDKAGINWKEINVLNYMRTHKMPDKDVSYLQYLSGEQGKATVSPDMLLSNLSSLSGKLQESKDKMSQKAGSELGTALENAKFDTTETMQDYPNKEISVLFMQISAPGYWESLGNIATTIAGGTAASFVTAPTLTGQALKGVFNLARANPIVTGILVLAGVAIHGGNVLWSQSVAAGYCGDTTVGSEARYGCSVVRLVNYDSKGIRQYCSEIASID